jgi:hypothetical protein
MNSKNELPDGWTLEAFIAHTKDLRELDHTIGEERDRRYTEVNIEKEKALKIKETADLAALGLAREIQTYKDEKANQLREQINSERGVYATKAEMKPVLDFMASQQGKTVGSDKTLGYMMTALVAINIIIGIIVVLK